MEGVIKTIFKSLQREWKAKGVKNYTTTQAEYGAEKERFTGQGHQKGNADLGPAPHLTS